jgi:hypothetical protein
MPRTLGPAGPPTTQSVPAPNVMPAAAGSLSATATFASSRLVVGSTR